MSNSFAIDVMEEIKADPYKYENLFEMIVRKSVEYLRENMNFTFMSYDLRTTYGYGQSYKPEAIIEIDYISGGHYLFTRPNDDTFFFVRCDSKYKMLTEGFTEHDFVISYELNRGNVSKDYEINNIPPAEIMLANNFGGDEYGIADEVDRLTDGILEDLSEYVTDVNHTLHVLNHIVQKNIKGDSEAIELVEAILAYVDITSVEDMDDF